MSQSRRAREREQRTNDIMNVALKHFVAKGYENASLDDMAAELELSKPAIYRYFDSKEDLFNAVRVRGMYLRDTMITEAVASGKTGLDKVYRIGVVYYEFWKLYPDHYRLHSISRGLARTNPESKNYQLILDYRRRFLKVVCGAIEEGKNDGSIRPDIDTLMTAVFARDAMMAVIEASDEYMRVMESSGRTTDEFVKHSMNLLLHSIKA